MSVYLYMNLATGEVTQLHHEAVEWYNDGCDVECFSITGKRLLWTHEGRSES